MEDREREFHRAMLNIYHRALKECDYSANRFLSMVNERGGLATAKSLLAGLAPQSGLTTLWECGRLDLSVEAHVLKPEFKALFTPEERRVARERLKEYRYTAPWDQPDLDEARQPGTEKGTEDEQVRSRRRPRPDDEEDLGVYPLPSAEQLHAARRVYQRKETRDADYREAKKLVDQGFQEASIPLMVEGLELLLRSWNSQLYRFRGGFRSCDRRGIEGLLVKHVDTIRGFRDRSIESLVQTDYQAVATLFWDFEELLGQTGTAKALHLLATEFFPLWDRRIAIGYQSCLRSLRRKDDRYFRFMQVTRRQYLHAGGRQAIGPNPLKAIDEYNYSRYTKGWI